MKTVADSGKLVLVTGGSGFVGVHCILQLLNQGYRVRTSLRSMTRKPEVIEMLRTGGACSVEQLFFIEADLTRDENWDKAVRDCDYVLHIATPISLQLPKQELDVIIPAVDGTLRVLRAASNAGVKRVVLTSSFAAIGYGPKQGGRPYTEDDWTDPNSKSLAGSAYIKSKVFAEKAAWEFMAAESGTIELAVINPVAIFGPLLGTDMSTGFQLLKGLMDGSTKAVPRINFGIVDVRDVADLHLRAMVSPNAAGQRFLAIGGEIMSFQEIAVVLKNNMGEHGKLITTRIMPDWMIRVASLFNAKAKWVLPQLNKVKTASNDKAKNLLGWEPRSNEEALVASADSLISFKLVRPTLMTLLVSLFLSNAGFANSTARHFRCRAAHHHGGIALSTNRRSLTRN